MSLPGRPYHLSGAEPSPAPPPVRAPRLGEHTLEILAELHEPSPLGEAARSTPSLRPLQGVRIVDFSWV